MMDSSFETLSPMCAFILVFRRTRIGADGGCELLFIDTFKADSRTYMVFCGWLKRNDSFEMPCHFPQK